MVSLYILGLLQRYGPQHGYQIKKTIAGQLVDFTQIKLPTIYYHLGKLADNGALSAVSEKPGSRPEKTVYSITEKGKKIYQGLLHKLLDTEYRPSFATDGIYFFADHYQPEEVLAHLQTYAESLRATITMLEKHKTESLRFVPEDARTMTEIIFNHHLHHYRAELAWTEETRRTLLQEEETTC